MDKLGKVSVSIGQLRRSPIMISKIILRKEVHVDANGELKSDSRLFVRFVGSSFALSVGRSTQGDVPSGGEFPLPRKVSMPRS